MKRFIFISICLVFFFPNGKSVQSEDESGDTHVVAKSSNEEDGDILN